MKVIKPLRLGVLTRVVEHRRKLLLSVGVIAFFPFHSPPSLLTEASLWKLVGKEVGGALDAALPKAFREVLVSGKAFAPNKTPAPSCRVRVQVGPMEKALNVFGDRFWMVGAASDPAPFAEMPIAYENAFGGVGYDLNPLGKGFAAPEERGAKHYLPNIEDPKLPIRAPKDRPPPAGFGPYGETWPQRRSVSGTYDDKWLAEVYPGYPDDMDFAAFNTAPEDQRTQGTFQGDEPVVIENMHPEKAVLETHLPGVLARCFVTQKSRSEETFREVPMAVETVYLFPHVERGVVLFRGLLPVEDEEAADILHLVVAAEHLGQPKTEEHYKTVLAQRLDRAKAHLYALRDRDLMPEKAGKSNSAIETDEIGEMQTLLAREGLVEKNAKRRAELELENARERLREQGIDPDPHIPKVVPPDEPPPDMEELPDYLERTMAKAEEEKAKAETAQKKAEEDARRTCEQNGLDYDALKEEQQKKAGGPPKFTAAGQMEHLREVAEMARNAGVEVPHVEAQLNDPALRTKLEAAEAQLREMYVRFAHEMPPAMPAEGEVSERVRREVTEDHAAGRTFRGRDLTGVSLSGLLLEGADFQDALLEKVDFSGADLRNANFSGAVLARADLRRANLKGANLKGANLGRATLAGARAEGADFAKATLYEADLSEADFMGANLSGADLSETLFKNTSFVDVLAPETNFLKSDLSELDLSGATLTKCNFLEVVVTGVSFKGANLTSAVFLGAKGSGAIFRDANLTNLRVVQESVFEDADFQNADLTGATLRSTRLAGSTFSGAKMDGADLSECDLREATFTRVSAKEARFAKADLTSADISFANVMGALFTRANLTGADLRGSNLFRADLLRVEVDGNTQTQGAETTDMRFIRPRRSHAQSGT